MIACCSPTAGDKTSLASCSPPQWGGGELRDSKSRNTYYNILSGSSLRRSRTSVKRVAGLRWREAAARATLRVAIPQFFGSQQRHMNATRSLLHFSVIFPIFAIGLYVFENEETNITYRRDIGGNDAYDNPCGDGAIARRPSSHNGGCGSQPRPHAQELSRAVDRRERQLCLGRRRRADRHRRAHGQATNHDDARRAERPALDRFQDIPSVRVRRCRLAGRHGARHAQRDRPQEPRGRRVAQDSRRGLPHAPERQGRHIRLHARQ